MIQLLKQWKRAALFAAFASVPLLFYVVGDSFASNDFANNQDGIIIPSTQHKKSQEYRDAEFTPPEAKKLRYAPLGNTVKEDPLNENYQQWIEAMRGQVAQEGDIDEEYEDFVREISPLLFSLSYTELSPDVKDFITNIPADSLAPLGYQFRPEGPLNLNRAAADVDPFADAAPAEEEIIGQDVGLNIDIREKDNRTDELLGMAYEALRSGQIEGAASIYNEVLESEPDNRDAQFGAATTFHRSGQIDEARDGYVRLLEKDPNYWPALNNLMVLAGEESPEDALKELKKLELINPEFSPIAAQIGVIYLRLNKVEEAVKYITRAIILSPDNLGYRYNLAVILDHAGHKPQAARLYQQLLDAHAKGYKLPETADKIRERLNFIASSPLAAR